jgi:hypothetical protein
MDQTSDERRERRQRELQHGQQLEQQRQSMTMTRMLPENKIMSVSIVITAAAHYLLWVSIISLTVVVVC